MCLSYSGVMLSQIDVLSKEEFIGKCHTFHYSANYISAFA